ncbi:MAG: polyketide cyclase [Planctomycetes bacterium B3_Pla]|nr:MAG: polyketide cyclase [Planctomycetes bacterium B3_Pla]
MGKCYNSVVIEAPCEKVWETICNFHDLAWAAGVVTEVEAEGDLKGDQVGAKRIINDAFHETLLTLDDQARTFSYSIDDGPEPLAKDSVSNYVGSVRLLPITESNTTFIEWQSTYESPDDNAIAEFCNPIYEALLSALKQHFS